MNNPSRTADKIYDFLSVTILAISVHVITKPEYFVVLKCCSIHSVSSQIRSQRHSIPQTRPMFSSFF